MQRTTTISGYFKHLMRPRLFTIFLFSVLLLPSLAAQNYCSQVKTSAGNGSLTIYDIAPKFYKSILDVYDENWNLIYNCNGTCERSTTINDLALGKYYIKYQQYSENWRFICNIDLEATITSDDNKPDLTLDNLRDYALTMEQGSVQNFTFDLKNIGNATAASTYYIEAYLDNDYYGNFELEKVQGQIITGNIGVGTTAGVVGAITVPFDFPPGSYQLIVNIRADVNEELNTNNNTIVSQQQIQVAETGGGGGDGGTGVQCGEIAIRYGNGIISMKGESNKNYFFKIHDLNNDWAEIFNCSYNCGSQQTATLPNGNYLVRVYNSNWGIICEQEINLSDNGGSGCGQDGDLDGDGICNDADNCRDTYNPDQADSDGNGIGDACQNTQPLSQLICPESMVVETNDPDGAIVTWDDPVIIPGATCQPAPNFGLRQEQGLPKGSKFPVGETIIQYSIYDIGSDFGICGTFITCQFSIIVTSTGGGGGNTIQCGAISITSTNNSIEMKGQNGENYFFKVHDLNNGWAEVFNCSYQCGSSQTANNLASGRYLVRTYDASWRLICEQEINLGANNRNATPTLATFTLFPNPAQTEIAIDLKEYAGEEAHISINNLYGQIVYQQNIEMLPSEALKIHLDDFVNGLYLVNIKLKNRVLKSEKFLVKRLY